METWPAYVWEIDPRIEEIVDCFDPPVDGSLLNYLLEVDEPEIEPTGLSAGIDGCVPVDAGPNRRSAPCSEATRLPGSDQDRDSDVVMTTASRKAQRNARERERRFSAKRREEEHVALISQFRATRKALADAAVLILANDAPGSDIIRAYLAAAHPKQR